MHYFLANYVNCAVFQFIKLGSLLIAFTFNTKLSLLKAKTELNYIGVQAYSESCEVEGAVIFPKKITQCPNL